MVGEVFDTIAVKEIHLAEVGGREPDTVQSGAMFISGAKLWIRGATANELVTSA